MRGPLPFQPNEIIALRRHYSLPQSVGMVPRLPARCEKILGTAQILFIRYDIYDHSDCTWKCQYDYDRWSTTTGPPEFL